MHEKGIQNLKKELKKSKEYINRDKKDKNEVLKKISELYKKKNIKIYKRRTNNSTKMSRDNKSAS